MWFWRRTQRGRARSPQIARAPGLLRTPLTACREGQRGLPAEARVRAFGVVITAPGFQHHPGMRQRTEQGLVQQLIAQPPVEAFDEGVLHRLAGGDVMPGDLLTVRPD